MLIKSVNNLNKIKLKNDRQWVDCIYLFGHVFKQRDWNIFPRMHNIYCELTCKSEDQAPFCANANKRIFWSQRQNTHLFFICPSQNCSTFEIKIIVQTLKPPNWEFGWVYADYNWLGKREWYELRTKLICGQKETPSFTPKHSLFRLFRAN
jgi:hypothetical protein